MAEPLSIAASTIAIVQATQLAGQALIAIHTYYGDVKKAPETARKLVGEIKSLEGILNQMKTYGEENKQSIAIPNLEENLKDCSKSLEKLQAMLYTTQKVSKLKKMLKGLKQALNKQEIADIMSQIQRYKETFSLGLAVENIFITRNVEARVQHIAQEQHIDKINTMKGHSEERWKKILHWVFAGSTSKKHIDITKRRRKETGKWFLQTPGVQSWITDPDSPIVWGHGIPGSGKTFLSSAAIDHVENENLFPTTEINGVAHIYFDYKDQEQQKAIDVLSSLVKQLAYQLPRPLKELEELYERKESKDRRPTTDELLSILLIIFTSFNRVFLIFDALDESDQRKEILPLIQRMSMKKVNVLVTSRPYPEDIQALFGHSTLKVEILAKEEDIVKYIKGKIDEDPRAKRLVGLGNCRGKIVSELVDCAKGMYVYLEKPQFMRSRTLLYVLNFDMYPGFCSFISM
ncbi:hypothetical protein P167DRAFT_68583 [Morchella conica CCBAS932]|uniref:NACHT domain-containing protein n=1 Tax=Morchella conica CCBAS932 TaxID=1392247 RepID=A0A3N4KV01_9PEZI|nr:hypothetical protein P167DRAFT_68583 [Morchella conica CCBAS932]